MILDSAVSAVSAISFISPYKRSSSLVQRKLSTLPSPLQMTPLITMPSTISLLNSLKQVLPKQHRRKILKTSRKSRQESLIKAKPEERHSSRLTAIDTILDGRESALLASFIISPCGLEAHPFTPINGTMRWVCG